MALLQWHIVTKNEFNEGVKQDGHIYFIKDTKEIYRGEQCFTEAVELYDGIDNLPEQPALNRLYFDKQTLEGRVHNGYQWITVILPVSDTIDEITKNPVSSVAVATYVAEQIEKGLTSASVINAIEYNDENKELVINHGDDSQTVISLSGLGANLTTTVDGNKNTIQMVDVNGDPVGDPIQLDVERFLTGAEYVSDSKKIVLYFDGKTGAESEDFLEIPVDDLVDVYTVESSDSIDLELVNNRIRAAVILSQEEGNALEIKEDGLYVNGAKYIEKDSIATTDTIASSFDDASDDKVVSEKSLFDFLEWKTTM